MNIEKRAYTSTEAKQWAQMCDVALRSAVNGQVPEFRKTETVDPERAKAVRFFEQYEDEKTGNILYLVPVAYQDLMPDSELDERTIITQWGLSDPMPPIDTVDETPSLFTRLVTWTKTTLLGR